MSLPESQAAREQQLREPVTAVMSIQGSMVGITTCSICGCALLIDQPPGQTTGGFYSAPLSVLRHHDWHDHA